MLIKKSLYVMTILFCFAHSINASTWKLFFYMDASDGLTDMAFKNMTDIIRGKANDTYNLVDVRIQLHAYDQTALRYQVTQNGLSFKEETTLSTNGKKDFIDAATWAFANNNADHTILIFSNHGYGALDPQWNEVTEKWEVADLTLANHGNQLCHLSSESCPISGERKKYKGFMFNGNSHTYLTNRELAEGMAYIQENLLNQNPVDIIAFDTCMGSMLEVATCVAPYANYLVGVQSCALRDGFDYQGFMAVLNQGNDPQKTAAQCIEKFDKYYATHDTAGIYTCAALDLQQVFNVNELLNTVVSQLLAHQELMPFLETARQKSHRFCLWPIYTDIVAYLKLVEHELLELPASDALDSIINSLYDFYGASEAMVIARCGGITTEGNAYGFSIYLPQHTMEPSYSTSLFGDYSQWPLLINKLCMQ